MRAAGVTDILVGRTGFVGSNLARCHDFSAAFHSADIGSAYGLRPDLCVYAGVRAEKFLAASDPDADMRAVREAISNIKKINPRRLALISTIDVYPRPDGVDENSPVTPEGASPYGKHRLYLEQWVRENTRGSLIIRLPALFGENIKKNFIYDLIHIIPSTLKADKYRELSGREPVIGECYADQRNGFYKCSVPDAQNAPNAPKNRRGELREAFRRLGFTALNFTDSRAVYQFYNLDYLWRHLEIALRNGLSLVNLAVEPVSAGEVHEAVRGEPFVNELGSPAARYDFRTVHARLFNGPGGGYIFRREQVLSEIRGFVNKSESRS